MNKTKLQELLKKLESLEDALPKSETLGLLEKVLNQKFKEVTQEVKDDSSFQFLDKINIKLDKFKKDFNLKPIITEIEALKDDLEQMHNSMISESDNITKKNDLTKTELVNLIKNTKDDLVGMTGTEIASLLKKISKLEEQSKEVKEELFKKEVDGLNARLEDIAKKHAKMEEMHGEMASNVSSKIQEQARVVLEEISKTRKEFFSRLSNLGGGNMNRQITVNGSASVLSKYTDINFQSSSSIGWNITVDDTKKWVSLSPSILAGGGGGSGSNDFLTVKEVDGSPTVGSVLTIRVSNGSLTDDGGGQVTINTSGGATGITRTVSVLSVSSTLAATANTDYVYFTNVGVQLTLPTAINNSNLYTVKNIVASSILISTSAGQTIDDSATALLPTKYESLSFISNGSVWSVV